MKKFRGVPNHGTFLWRLNNLQPYPQPGGYQTPEEDEDAETPVDGNDALA